MKIWHLMFVLALASVTVSIPVHSQETIVRDVVASGGGKTAGSGYQLLHTVGQPVIDISATTDHTQETGFWYMPWMFITDAGEGGEIPSLAFRLYQNYPNPFNPLTTIRFVLPVASHVSMKIYDVLGREIMTVIDKAMGVGVHEMTVQVADLASGIYFYRIKAGWFIETRKMVILR